FPADSRPAAHGDEHRGDECEGQLGVGQGGPVGLEGKDGSTGAGGHTPQDSERGYQVVRLVGRDEAPAVPHCCGAGPTLIISSARGPGAPASSWPGWLFLSMTLAFRSVLAPALTARGHG